MKIKVTTSNDEIRRLVSNAKETGQIVGLVPTMGALHQGHLSLVQEANKKADFTVASIFVNPTQFDDNSDLEKYPRSLDADIHMLEEVNCNAVYVPSSDEVYKDSKPFEFDFNGLNKPMEGEYRAGHFQGVVQVVKRLFEIINPDLACFGLKDFQQYAIIKEMVNQLNIPIDVIGCETIREENGLAMSSRNQLLAREDLQSALLISKALRLIQQNYRKHSPAELKALAVEPLQKEINLEYLEIADSDRLQPIESWSEAKHARAFIAAKVGEVRLIDNMEIF